MAYCPQCRSEYPDGTDRCADCDVALVDTPPADNDEASSPDPDAEMVALRSYPSQIHAQMVAEALANAGIYGMIKSNEMFGAGTGLGSLSPTRVEIWVPADKLDEARTIADGTIDPV
jgi:hypothetical protein